MEPHSCIQPADLLQGEVGREAVAVRRPVDGQVVQDDRLAVRRQHDIDLDSGRASGLRRFEPWQRVLRVVEAVAAMTADMDTTHLAGQEAESHVQSVLPRYVDALLYRRALTVSRTTSSTGK